MKNYWFQRKYSCGESALLTTTWSRPVLEDQTWTMDLDLELADKSKTKRIAGVDPIDCLVTSLDILGNELSARFLPRQTDSLGLDLNITGSILWGTGLRSDKDSFFAGSSACEWLANDVLDVDGVSEEAIKFLRSYDGAVLSRCLEVSGKFVFHACRQPERLFRAWKCEGSIWSAEDGRYDVSTIGIDPLQALLANLQTQTAFLGRLDCLENEFVQLERDYFPGTGAFLMSLPEK